MKIGTAIIGMVVTGIGGYVLRGFTNPTSEDAASAGGAVVQAGDEVERLRVPVGLSPFKGARDAKVTIVEFSDFQ